MDTERSLWAAVAERLGYSVPDAARQFLRTQGLVETVLDAPVAASRSIAFEDLIPYVEDMRTSGLIGGATIATPDVSKDPRWGLIAELKAKLHPDALPWAPLSFLGQAADPFGRLGDLRLRVEFDARMPLDQVVKALREAWPRLREQGVVRQTRRWKPRAVALIRHVCLDIPPEASWSARLTAWNQRYAEWAFKDARAFNTEFHKLEAALTGSKRGLAPFYDPEEWALIQPIPEFFRLLDSANPGAEKAADRFDPDMLRRFRLVAEGRATEAFPWLDPNDKIHIARLRSTPIGLAVPGTALRKDA